RNDYVQEEKQQQLQEPLDGQWKPTTTGHDAIVPFSEPKPVTISEKAGVKFKPLLDVNTGCAPYAAVNAEGETSGGLQTSGDPESGCRGSKYGSQVYGRSTWYNDVWAIMYAWYFPKDSPMLLMGHRHDWENVVVFINDPDEVEPTILGCSTSWHSGYIKYAPCPTDSINGSSVMIKYEHSFPLNHALNITKDAGAYQDLIMWHQMPDLARRALNDTDFGKAITPMNDLNFMEKIEAAWPFKTKKDGA
nr:Chain A, Nep1-like protein [Hyaloperonospora arabidopsidis]